MDLPRFDPRKLKVEEKQPRVRFPILNRILSHLATGLSVDPLQVEDEAFYADELDMQKEREAAIIRGMQNSKRQEQANPGIRDLRGNHYKNLDEYLRRNQ